MFATQLQLTLPDWIRHAVDTHRVYGDDESCVALAIDLARKNVEMKTGGPFGAVVFTGEGRVVSVGVNRVIEQSCSVAHAEIMAYMLAQTRLQRKRLNEGGEKFVLATSAQPCCQCYGATVWAGIDELLIGARTEDTEELTEFNEGPLPADWIGELNKLGIVVRRDILRERARNVFKLYAQYGGEHY
jgi:tRNA(Arg) A34 adenosine deaminase TadA